MNSTELKRNIESIFFILLYGFIFVYILLRAVYSPVIHDEAETFFIYIQSGNFIPPNAYLDANNHLLNSFLSYLSWEIFGTSLLALRLPNVLAAIVYLLFVFKISMLLKNKTTKWFYQISMLCVHFLIEFFSYSRGYGLSMALLLASIYYLFQFNRLQHIRHIIYSVLFISGAFLANLSLVNTFVLFHLLLGIVLITNYKKFETKAFLLALTTQLIVGLTSFLYLTNYILTLRSNGSLYYGSDESLWSVTLVSLSKVLFTSSPHIFSYILSVSIVLVVVLSLIKLYKNSTGSSDNWTALFFPVLFFGNILMSYIISKVLDVNLPEDRAALYFVPLLIGSIAFIGDQQNGAVKYFKYLMFAPFALVIFHFFSTLSINFSSYTPHFRIPQEFYDYIEIENKKRDIPLVAEAYREHRTEWYFNNIINSYYLSPLAYTEFPSKNFEFVMSDSHEFPDWANNYNKVIYDVESDKYLLKRKIDIQPKQLDQNKIGIKEYTDAKYLNFYKTNLVINKKSNLLIVVECQLDVEMDFFNTAIIAKANNSNGENIKHTAAELNRLLPKENGDYKTYKISMVLPQIQEEEIELIVFAFNKDQVPYRIKSAQTWIYSYE